jgi:hypothetical protein
MTITTQAVRELVDKLIPTGLVEYRTGELSRLPAECIAMLLALVEERDRLAEANAKKADDIVTLGQLVGKAEARAEAAEAALREMRSEEMIERVARAWATMDGKADLFDREKGLPISEHIDDPTFTGAYEGYMEDARELMRRSELIKRATFQGRDGDG